MLLDKDFGRVLELRPDPDLPPAEHPLRRLATIDRIPDGSVDVERTFHMDQVGEGWGINGERMDMSRIDQTINFGDTERWVITVGDGIHTFHVHQTQFQILEINGEPPPPEDAGWEDTVLVSDDREVVVIARFDSYTNPDIAYMFHCHILDHEHLGMMGLFRVVEE